MFRVLVFLIFYVFFSALKTNRIIAKQETANNSHCSQKIDEATQNRLILGSGQAGARVSNLKFWSVYWFFKSLRKWSYK
jgi:hypothetical protein